jgi:hypothetical protein
VTATITDTDRGMAAFAARLIGNKTVRVGILSDEPKRSLAHPGEGGKRGRETKAVTFDQGQHATLLEVAIINEFGGGHVPQRSFIRATIDENLDRIHAAQVALAKQIVLAQITGDQAMARLGAFVAGLIKARIAAGIEPANAASTIERKGSSKPLISTGQLRSAITFAVEDAK